MERRNITDSPMEIYVHIPFCIKKCDYCDFLSGPSGPKEQADYVDALLEEINAAEEGKGRSVSSVFIGGGTPSVLDERFIGEILNHIRRKFQIADHAEITIEVNPGTADRNKLQAYRTYGINRLSIGLQSPDDRELKILGRIHNYEQFLETYRSAREAGFDNINIDLMSAIPDQTYEGWIHNLRTVAGLDPEHISAYSLIIEEGTPFASRTLNLPDEDEPHRHRGWLRRLRKLRAQGAFCRRPVPSRPRQVPLPPKSMPRAPARFSPPTASAAHTPTAFSLKLRAEESAR